jgi:osmotically-inducible protein OsmY
MLKKSLLALAITATALSQTGCFTLGVAGVAATALAADDRRSTGIYVEDENVEWKALGRVREAYKDVHFNATSYNLTVLITGEAPDAKARDDITQIVKNIPSVRAVNNEMQIAGATSITSRANDTLITSNVKARFIGNGRVSPNHVKVVTEMGTVFLMGIVSRAEGDAAADIARTAAGVLRVVKVFDYLPAPPQSAK